MSASEWAGELPGGADGGTGTPDDTKRLSGCARRPWLASGGQRAAAGLGIYRRPQRRVWSPGRSSVPLYVDIVREPTPEHVVSV